MLKHNRSKALDDHFFGNSLMIVVLSLDFSGPLDKASDTRYW